MPQGFDSGTKVSELYPDAVTRTVRVIQGLGRPLEFLFPFYSFLFRSDLVEYVFIADALAHIQQLWLKGMSSQQRNVGNINPSTRDVFEHSHVCGCLFGVFPTLTLTGAKKSETTMADFLRPKRGVALPLLVATLFCWDLLFSLPKTPWFAQVDFP